MKSYQDVEKASAVEVGVPIEVMKDAPGKGHMVIFHDPEAFLISLVYGQEPVDRQEPPVKITINCTQEKPWIREFLRFKPGPAAVYKASFISSLSRVLVSCLVSLLTMRSLMRSLVTMDSVYAIIKHRFGFI